ncbi:MAG: PRC-barrel domain containing protein, partial [Pseudomonadota bacterium]|nr:PRC-barrel domain containing protein [Pseudomonadota bacterium]
FIIDDQEWLIRYLEVDTRNFWPGKKVLIAPQWITQISWLDSKVFVNLSRQLIQTAPAYDPQKPIDSEYEHQLKAHYGR